MAISSLPPNNNPENTVLREDNDATLIGLYSSLAAGGLMLAYAIYYVTVVNVSDDYSYLTLGIITGLTGISVIADTIEVTIAIPADGPSFGVAPSGT